MIKEKKKRETLIIGLIALIAGILLIIFTLCSGAFHSEIVLDRMTNSVYVKGVFSQDKIASYMDVQHFKSKPGYRTSFLTKQGSLCYNLELVKIHDGSVIVFPFCISSSAKMKSVEKAVNAFVDKPVGFQFKTGLYSITNLIWFVIGLFAAVAGGLLIRKVFKNK